MSHVTCHVSYVACPCHMSQLLFCSYNFFLQSGGATLWRVCYQRGLPRLVFQVEYPFSNPLSTNGCFHRPSLVVYIEKYQTSWEIYQKTQIALYVCSNKSSENTSCLLCSCRNLLTLNYCSQQWGEDTIVNIQS